jgi:histidine triad (HIT) family protein
MRTLLLFLLLASALRADDARCIFCRIAAHEAAAVELWREGDVLAIMDRAPRNPGHVLVIPAAHAENLLDVPPRTLEQMATLAQRVARAIRATDLRAEGIQLQMNTGAAAGQSVFHAHLHVISRFAGDAGNDARAADGKRPITPPAELEAVAARIRAQLARAQ